jgi:hypothetical protein
MVYFEHRHSAICYVTPAERHHGSETLTLERRRQIYDAARSQHPERWSGKTRNWNPVTTVRLKMGQREKFAARQATR